MKGLFIDNFYKTIHSMKLILVFIFIAALFVLIAGNNLIDSTTLLSAFICVCVPILAVNGVSSTRKDAEANWDKYELILPVTRKQIVNSKYISYMFYVLIGAAIASVTVGLALLIHGNIYFVYGLRDFLSIFVLAIGIAMLTGGFFYPLAERFGSDKSETFLILSVICGIGVLLLLTGAVNSIDALKENTNFNYYIKLGIVTTLYILIYVMSYFSTCFIYKKKEI